MSDLDEYILEGAALLSILTVTLMITIGPHHPLITVFMCAITTGLTFEIRKKFTGFAKYAWLAWLMFTILWMIILLKK